MSKSVLEQLRALRKRTAALHETVVDDLRPFQHRKDGVTFRRLPSSASEEGDVTVASTATVVMALAAHPDGARVYPGMGPDEIHPYRRALDALLDAEWTSSSLPYENAFTRTLVLRTAGFLASWGMPAQDLLALSHPERPPCPEHRPWAPDPARAAEPSSTRRSEQLRDDKLRRTIVRPLSRIISEMASDRKQFGVLKYPPAMTLAYWFVDAVDRLHADLEEREWRMLAKWAGETFSRQMSLVAARHTALMDPVALTMAACVSARLRQIGATGRRGWTPEAAAYLPADVELREGIRRLFAEQGSAGIWPKYFPLFHYPDGGINFTFSFEFLEALLVEFANTDLLLEPEIVDGLARAVAWCEQNRLEFRDQRAPVEVTSENVYRGWNSGGQTHTLEQGMPESWATGAVHLFLGELERALSSAINRLLLTTYARTTTRERVGDRRRWDDIMDTAIVVTGHSSTVKRVIEEDMLNPMDEQRTAGTATRRDLRLPRRRSALLFGPPGTSKTRVVSAFAAAVGWPFVEINPSHFLTNGLDSIYGRANEIFADLNDLTHAVVLFDEMDALVRRRGAADDEPLDVTREFLTTTMLPKLAELHDRARVFYFMATNHRTIFDEAIIRSGRFDLHIFMGVPSWEEKREHLNRFLPGVPTVVVERARQLFGEWVADRPGLGEQLRWFSYGEMVALLEAYAGPERLEAVLNDPKARVRFEELVSAFTTQRVALREGSTLRKEYERDRSESVRQ